PSGDDALAMSLSKILKIRIEKVYLATDLVVLFLSLSYIPIGKILYSLLTVVLSGQIIGLIQKLKKTDQN
ncbi:MAG: YitT family protein, partial [Christensenellaceae bacterium]|nr:YitT family protein [Christensenellaceae bacterium]